MPARTQMTADISEDAECNEKNQPSRGREQLEGVSAPRPAAEQRQVPVTLNGF